MKKIIVAIVFVFTVLFGAQLAAAYEMPYCPCIEMNYCPQGPDIPDEFHGEQVSAIIGSFGMKLTTLAVDIGNLPYSVPDYGWHCVGQSPLVTAELGDLYATQLAMNVYFEQLECCGQSVVPIDPLFIEPGVTLVWNPLTNVYFGSAGGNLYAMEVRTVESGGAFLTLYELYEAIYGSNGALSGFVVYSTTTVQRNPVRQPMSVEVK